MGAAKNKKSLSSKILGGIELVGNKLPDPITLFITNFSTFAPFGMAMIAVAGLGAAEKIGFLAVLMRKLLLKAPPVLNLPPILVRSVSVVSGAAFVL